MRFQVPSWSVFSPLKKRVYLFKINGLLKINYFAKKSKKFNFLLSILVPNFFNCSCSGFSLRLKLSGLNELAAVNNNDLALKVFKANFHGQYSNP